MRWLILSLLGALFVSLLAGIVWAAQASALSDGPRRLFADRWGLVTLLDLYCGIALASIWIALLERRWTPWLVWTILMLGLGNLAALLYFILRLARHHSLRQAMLGGTARVEGT